MILDLERFVTREQPRWRELEDILKRIEEDPGHRMDLAGVRRFHHLYLKAGADLAKVQGQTAAPQLKAYLESLVSRAYAEIHENRDLEKRFSPWIFLSRTFPRTFRKHANAFWLAVLITLVGACTGGALLHWDPEAKAALLPFDHLHGAPSDRVAAEETTGERNVDQPKGYFAAYLMTHNIKVSILTFALGFVWGAGPLLLLFYNGVILGAVAFDYIADGQWVFLMGWLLPHGVIEIPAILLAGQAGLVLGARVLRGRSREQGFGGLRAAAPDAAVIMGGVAVMLVWAGIIEAFFSQYHAPILPYSLKIAFGCLEFAALVIYLGFAGRKADS